MFPPSKNALVLRSSVNIQQKYQDYNETLRFDFFHACAYCFISEQEAHGISFEIDHYLPKSSFPDLTCEYTNLMYACKVCNRYKGNIFSCHHEQANGHRFFRADYDFFGDHFTIDGNCLVKSTEVGEYTIEYLFLNREALQRIRAMRRRLADCDNNASIGMLWLRQFHIDRLPQNLRLRGRAMIQEAIDTGTHVKDTAELVRKLNKSDLLVRDQDAEVRERQRRLKLLRDRMLA